MLHLSAEIIHKRSPNKSNGLISLTGTYEQFYMMKTCMSSHTVQYKDLSCCSEVGIVQEFAVLDLHPSIINYTTIEGVTGLANLP